MRGQYPQETGPCADLVSLNRHLHSEGCRPRRIRRRQDPRCPRGQEIKHTPHPPDRYLVMGWRCNWGFGVFRETLFFRSVRLAIISTFVLPCTEGGLEFKLYNEFGLRISISLRMVPLCFQCALPTSKNPNISSLLHRRVANEADRQSDVIVIREDRH